MHYHPTNEQLQEIHAQLMGQVQMEVFDRTPEMVTFPEKTYTKWFDYDKIRNNLVAEALENKIEDLKETKKRKTNILQSF